MPKALVRSITIPLAPFAVVNISAAPSDHGQLGPQFIKGQAHVAAAMDHTVAVRAEHEQVSPRRKSFIEKLRDYFTEEAEPDD